MSFAISSEPVFCASAAILSALLTSSMVAFFGSFEVSSFALDSRFCSDVLDCSVDSVLIEGTICWPAHDEIDIETSNRSRLKISIV